MSITISNQTIKSEYSQLDYVKDLYKNNHHSSKTPSRSGNSSSIKEVSFRNAHPKELHNFLSYEEKKVLKEIFNNENINLEAKNHGFQPKTNVSLLKGSKIDIRL